MPAAIVSSFVGKEIDPTMCSISLIGLGGGLIYIGLAYLLNRRAGKERQAFEILNLSGYNIRNFTLPFVQSFLGSMGVVTTSLFDVGNAVICMGGAYSIAAIVKDGQRFSFRRIGKTLSRSVPFVCYIIVVTMNLAKIPMPKAVVSCAEIIGGANAFAAMLMIGVGFKLELDRSRLGEILKMLLIRYGVALVLALGCVFLLPFSEQVKQTLVILLFSPIASVAPGFTEELKSDVGLASAINSISIICSIVMIVGILLVML